jgi:hypothetical protein
MVVWTDPSLIGVGDGAVNKPQRDPLGNRKEKTMSGQNHLMSNAYVDAYQSELRRSPCHWIIAVLIGA